ncbi:MAG TPA: shikimate kinase, partial [Thermoplasmata archaeon]|nr:shikimate kinase [Thermoplasmata archaeon]
MRMKARAWGAVSVVNAIATGKGASFGIDLGVEAEADLFPGDLQIECAADDTLVRKCFEEMAAQSSYYGGGLIKIESSLPVSRGLKSSSAVANAVCLVLAKQLNVQLSALDLVQVGVGAAKEAKVTVTGAFDDACASMFGELCLTDNHKMEVLKRGPAPEYEIALSIPGRPRPKSQVNVASLEARGEKFAWAFELAMLGKVEEAMSINGWEVAEALKDDTSVIKDALEAG